MPELINTGILVSEVSRFVASQQLAPSPAGGIPESTGKSSNNQAWCWLEGPKWREMADFSDQIEELYSVPVSTSNLSLS